MLKIQNVIRKWGKEKDLICKDLPLSPKIQCQQAFLKCSQSVVKTRILLLFGNAKNRKFNTSK